MPHLRSWLRNINRIPFRRGQLRHVLGSADPRPIVVAGETLPFGRLGFQPSFAATTGRILIATRSTGTYAPASARAARLPTLLFRDAGYRCESYPRPSSPRKPSNGPLLRVDYRMAASEPTARLFLDFHQLCDLDSLRDLNLALVCSLFAHPAYPGTLTPAFYGAHGLLVCEECRRFPILTPHTVLYPMSCLQRGCPEGHFGRNQLSVPSIGFSPLSPTHPSS